MGSVTSALPLSLEPELPRGIHNFTEDTGDTFKVALIVANPSGDYGEDTTNYSELVGNGDELPNGSGYMTGGYSFTAGDNITPALNSGKAVWQWAVTPTWSPCSFSTSGCIIYNASKDNRVVFVKSFGGVVTLIDQSLILNMPTLDSVSALFRMRKDS